MLIKKLPSKRFICLGSNRLVSIVVSFFIYVQSLLNPTDLIFSSPQSGEDWSRAEQSGAERREAERSGEEWSGAKRIGEKRSREEWSLEERSIEETRGD